MNHLRTFERFTRGYIDRKAMSFKAPKSIGYLKEPVEIRIDIEKIQHATDRQFRHGGMKDEVISDNDIIETIELAIEEITIALMQNKFDIYQNEDDYPTKGVKAGEPNRFVIKNKTNNINVVCQLEPGDNEFKLTVITVMRKPDFKTYHGQYVVEVES
jgi:hypothetical protein